MDRRNLVLAVLSASDGSSWSPVQVQKIFFLLDQKIPDEIDAPNWAFQAYDYGPFDSMVYSKIEELEAEGLAVIDGGAVSRGRRYRLTAAGQIAGRGCLEQMSLMAQDYVPKLVAWVRSLSFHALVSAVYNEFPAMKEKSVFKT